MDEAPKRPRGRPGLIAPWYAEMIGQTYPDIHTTRGRQNKAAAFEGIKALGMLPEPNEPLPPPTYLVDWAGANRGKLGAIKWSVLEQLGRMSLVGVNDETIRRWALEIEQE